MTAYTTANFLTSVERQSFSPANQSTFSTADILELAGEVLQIHVVPAIMKAREEYFIDYADTTLVSGRSAYPIPPRSIGMAIREIQLLDSTGNIANLPRISLDSLHARNATSSTPECFYLRGDNIVLFPTPSSSSLTLRIYYPLRPGDLVAVSSSAIISAINTSTNVITVTSIPSTWVTGNIFDLVQASGSQSYLDTDLTSTLVSGADITLPSLPTGLAVGDYVSLQGQSSLIQLPSDLRPVLATLVAAEMLIGMGRPNGTALAGKGIAMLQSAQSLLTPRVVGEDEMILPDWS